MTTCIIGVDCSTNPKKTGYAIYHYESRMFLHAGHDDQPPLHERLLRDFERFQDDRVLVCFDAPLGWPAAFDPKGHLAGDTIDVPVDAFFRRVTDLHCRKVLGKQPLDVTNSWIARTAYHTLAAVGEITRRYPDLRIVWDAGETFQRGFIEVYPAAWLLSEGFALTDYKRDDDQGRKARRSIAGAAAGLFRGIRSEQIDHSHTFDACICCLNGADFLDGRCIAPTDAHVPMETVRKEGWIWLKAPVSGTSNGC